MAKLKPSIKSLILAGLVVVINFLSYLTFRFIFFDGVGFFESIGYTLWVSVWDFLIVYTVSFIIFRSNL